ncbi:DUF937 domain-containing protein [Antrihabitans sp. YC2-6]|uniref:DUF937 domain-containing protein n=1 Tax=Antrihabitans sp. YC2-6 TaxID=2799498 RepID=UPI0018F3771B|nr:DUF937 domain-containing protein [Antrihabitans sp. YC2-6]MBJ8344518.1 DUF937 domain-containing protein [Antrihabitans sp. YC2-6]
MASLEDLLSQIPISQIAGQLGVDEQTATNAVKAAIPTLVGGLEANAQDPKGAASLENALSQHGDLLDGGVDINQVDVNDGTKIVSNIFGSAQNQVVSTLGSGVGGGGNELIKQLLPILAPIVLAYVAKQLTGGGGAATPAPTPTPQAQSAGGGVLGDLLGGLLRSATSGSGSGGSAGGLGGVLGGILGGNAGGALGDVLGGLLGGGKR